MKMTPNMIKKWQNILHMGHKATSDVVASRSISVRFERTRTPVTVIRDVNVRIPQCIRRSIPRGILRFCVILRGMFLRFGLSNVGWPQQCRSRIIGLGPFLRLTCGRCRSCSIITFVIVVFVFVVIIYLRWWFLLWLLRRMFLRLFLRSVYGIRFWL